MFVTVNCASHIGHDAMNNAAVPKWERDPYRWYIFRDSVDREIRHQIAGETPTGGSTDWNEHWQWRIKTAQHFADPEKHVNYIIQRRKRNLHPLLFYSKAHWPFQHNRTPATVLVTTLLLILWVIRSARGGFGVRPSPAAATFVQRWVLAGFRTFGVSSLSAPGDGRTPTAARAAQKFATRNSAFEIDLTARERRRFTHPLWQQSLSVFMMVALIFTTTPTEVHAQVYSPVFYYYIADHLGSSSVMTDRAGVLVQHYEYAAYGNERYNAGTPALQVSNRYTGQVLDEETGLYYYNARYYDPELGRFTQPDTIVPDPSHSQSLNRYTYANNSPLVYVDPSGHLVWFAIPLILAAVGAAVGGIQAAASGGNVGAAMLGGAISGFGAGLGPVGAIVGGALGGAVSAAVAGGTGSQIATSALIGGIAGGVGYGVGQAVGKIANPVIREIAQFGTSVAVGAAVGAGAAWATGGDVAKGAMWGAVGGAIGYGASKAASALMKNSPKTEQQEEARKQDALEADKAKSPQLRPPQQNEQFGVQVKEYGDSQYPIWDARAFNEDGVEIAHINARKTDANILFVDESVTHPDYQQLGINKTLYGEILKRAGAINEIQRTPVGANAPAINGDFNVPTAKSATAFGFSEHSIQGNVLISRRPPRPPIDI